MPDWFYRTCSQPLLFRLPVPLAAGIAHGVMGTLTRIPGGTLVVNFLGHMVPDPRLRCIVHGVEFPAPVGIGAEVDPTGYVTRAFQQFGTGFVEVGPIRVAPSSGTGIVSRWPDQLGWWTPDPRPMPGLAFWKSRLARLPKSPVAVVARVGVLPKTSKTDALQQLTEIIRELAPHVTVFALETLRIAADEGWTDDDWLSHAAAVSEEVHRAGKSLWVCLPVDLDPAEKIRWQRLAVVHTDGVMIDGSLRHEGGILHGTPGRELALETLRSLRMAVPELPIIAAGGIASPGDALRFFEAGATLLRVDTGLVYAGPGLVKRINEALVVMPAAKPQADAKPQAAAFADRHAPHVPVTERSWLWSALMGAGLLVVALAAIIVASTRVVLPYDEDFSGLTREQLHAANSRLLLFLTHDRVTLGGATLGLSIIQVFMAVFGIRRGLHWSRVVVLTTGGIGFATFFLFLGFGYLDPLHAFVTTILFQFFLMAIHTRLSPPAPSGPVTLEEDDRWRLALWGQLLVIAQGVAVLTAGLTISFVGITWVFVHTDLEFMQTTAEELRRISPHLVPLVAHDRATFGGMLICIGLSVLMTGLWGFRERAAWIWWMLLVSGTIGYTATLMVHLHVGYTDAHHLAPALAGLIELWLALALSRPFLLGPHPEATASRQASTLTDDHLHDGM